MNKVKYFIVNILFTWSAFAQCDYDQIIYDDKSKTLLITSKAITLDIYETPYNGRLLTTKLSRSGNFYTMEFEITQDSSTQDLKPICFKSGDRVDFALSNNTNLSLMQTEDKICGVKFENTENGFTTVTNYIKVILTQDAFDKLSKNEVILIRIASKEFKEKFVIKNELEQVIGDEVMMTNPSRFFMDNIECLTKPQF